MPFARAGIEIEKISSVARDNAAFFPVICIRNLPSLQRIHRELEYVGLLIPSPACLFPNDEEAGLAIRRERGLTL